jgi:hypothetical protein
VNALMRTLLLLAVTASLGFGNISITATNPNFGTQTGVTGDYLMYSIQDFTLSGPAGGGVVGTWTLTIDTNYGINTVEPSNPNHGSIAGDTSLPVFCDNGAISAGGLNPCPGSVAYFMSDFLIEQGSTNFGIVMSSGHLYYGNNVPPNGDGTVAGDVYKSNSVQNSQHGALIQGPVIIGSAATLVDTGSLIVAANTDSMGRNCFGQPHNFSGGGNNDCAEYKITETFQVSSAANFFDPTQSFTMIASSADCFNDVITYHSTVPEPSGLVWIVPALLLAGAYLRRRSLSSVN